MSRLFFSIFVHMNNSTGHQMITFAARYGVIPVSADSMQAGERWLSEQSVTCEALKGNGHSHTVVLTNHNTVPERSRVRAPLQLIRWEKNKYTK